MEINFDATLWLWSGEKAAWHFVTLPPDAAEQIRFAVQGQSRRGFGSVKVEVTTGAQTWRTSCFPSKEHDSYLLSIKSAVRKAENIKVQDQVSIRLRLLEV